MADQDEALPVFLPEDGKFTQGKIACHCGACEIMFRDNRPHMAVECNGTCCRQHLCWATKKGAPPVDWDAFNIQVTYYGSDIIGTTGEEFMANVIIRENDNMDMVSNRITCNKCYSTLAVHLPYFYGDKVFAFLSMPGPEGQNHFAKIEAEYMRPKIRVWADKQDQGKIPPTLAKIALFAFDEYTAPAVMPLMTFYPLPPRVGESISSVLARLPLVNLGLEPMVPP